MLLNHFVFMTNFPTSISTGMFADHIFTPDLFKRICTAVHVILHQAAHFLQLHVNSAIRSPCRYLSSFLSQKTAYQSSQHLSSQTVLCTRHRSYLLQPRRHPALKRLKPDAGNLRLVRGDNRTAFLPALTCLPH